jgi:transposase
MMVRVTKVSGWLSIEELELLLKRTKDKKIAQRILVVLNASVKPRPALELAQNSGVARQTVHNWVSQYNRFGPDFLFVKKPRKPSPRLLSRSEETALMESFLSKAKKGRIATGKEIQRALEDILGFCVHHSSVYRMMNRNGWRRIVPRPQHVRADMSDQEKFKKTLPNDTNK